MPSITTTRIVTSTRKGILDEKLKRVPAGLDNAVRQAEERRLDKIFIVDADCHQEEPFSLFLKHLKEPYRSIVDKENIFSWSAIFAGCSSGWVV